MAALDRAAARPDEVMFFDDSAVNVAGAAAVGIRAFHVQGVEGVRERLSLQGLL